MANGVPQECFHWARGHGCFRHECRFNHSDEFKHLNYCHRWQRGKPCYVQECHRIHEHPAPPVATPVAEAIATAIRKHMEEFPAVERHRRAKCLQLVFHPDRYSNDPMLLQLFGPTTRILTEY